MATITKTKNVEPDMVYEPPLSIGMCIDKKTVENTPMTMGHTDSITAHLSLRSDAT